MVVHGGDRVELNRNVTTEMLVIHRGRKATTIIELAGHQIVYDVLTITGQGKCEVTDRGRVLISSDSDGDTVLRR